jgi:hypothetical protein
MRWWWLFALLACGLLGLVACGPASDCPEGLHPFKNGCADRLTINFMTCTEGRGSSLEEKRRARLEGAVDTAFRATGGEGVVDVAREVVETENTSVARDIVRYCLELTNRIPDIPPSQSREIVRFIDELESDSGGVADTPAAPAETPSDPSPAVTIPPTPPPPQEPTSTSTPEPTATPTPISTSPVDNCFAQFFEELPENTVEVGASDVDVSKRDGRAVIKFTEDRNTIGAIKLNFFRENQFFKIEEIVDLNCQTITEYKNVTRGGDKNILRNFDVLEFIVENSTYQLRIGDRGVVFRVGFSKIP